MSTDHDSAPVTDAAPTSAADSETTKIPPATHRSPELAWSSDELNESRSDNLSNSEHRPSRLIWSALVALVVAIASAVIFLGTTYLRSEHPNAVVTHPKSSASHAPNSVPSTVTVTAAPPPTPSAATPITTAALQDADYSFIDDLDRGGMHAGTRDAAEFSVNNAHQVCAYRASHDEAATQRYAATITSWMQTPNPAAFTSLSELRYCPRYLPANY